VALPPLTDAGELPLGVHRASLREILDQFGVGSAQRKVLALRLDRVYRLAEATNHLARFVVFGSFVTNKLEPQDVDVFLVMEDTFDASQQATLLRSSTMRPHKRTSVRACSGSDIALRGQTNKPR